MTERQLSTIKREAHRLNSTLGHTDVEHLSDLKGWVSVTVNKHEHGVNAHLCCDVAREFMVSPGGVVWSRND